MKVNLEYPTHPYKTWTPLQDNQTGLVLWPTCKHDWGGPRIRSFPMTYFYIDEVTWAFHVTKPKTFINGGTFQVHW